MTMGDKIKALRKEKGMTLEQLGDLVGVGKSTVRKWENGMIANMRRDKIARLSKALGTTPAYLLGWEDEATADILKDNLFIEAEKTPDEIINSENERLLLHAFRQMPEEKQEALLKFLRIKEE